MKKIHSFLNQFCTCFFFVIMNPKKKKVMKSSFIFESVFHNLFFFWVLHVFSRTPFHFLLNLFVFGFWLTNKLHPDHDLFLGFWKKKESLFYSSFWSAGFFLVIRTKKNPKEWENRPLMQTSTSTFFLVFS